MLCLIVFCITSCSSTGSMQQSTGTNVSLQGNNYKVVKAGAKGESSGFYLFGIIPLFSPNYADAKANLYYSSGELFEGRSIALTNQTQDRSTLYLILFSVPRITVTADIIEFTGAALENK
ncbi:MAG: DUF6567 family protein [Pseudomonadota bacterium]